MTVADLQRQLESWYKPNDLIAYTLWTETDVMEAAKEEGITLSEDELSDIMYELADNISNITNETAWLWIQELIANTLNGRENVK